MIFIRFNDTALAADIGSVWHQLRDLGWRSMLYRNYVGGSSLWRALAEKVKISDLQIWMTVSLPN